LLIYQQFLTDRTAARTEYDRYWRDTVVCLSVKKCNVALWAGV